MRGERLTFWNAYIFFPVLALLLVALCPDHHPSPPLGLKRPCTRDLAPLHLSRPDPRIFPAFFASAGHEFVPAWLDAAMGTLSYLGWLGLLIIGMMVFNGLHGWVYVTS